MESVATEVLRLFFLQVGPCLFDESLWRAHYISGNWVVLELLAGPLLFVRSLHIERFSLANSNSSLPWLLTLFLLKLCL